MIRIAPTFCLVLLAMTTPVAAQQAISCIFEPSRQFTLTAPIQGIIAEVLVDRGDEVSQGDVLVRIDARVEQASLETARFRAESTAAIRSREAQLNAAEQLLAQVVSLNERGVASQNQLNEAQANRDIAVAGLAEAEENRVAARLEIERAAAALDLRIIRAPADGVILEREPDVGELASPSVVIAEMVSVDTLFAEILISERDVAAIELGDMVDLTPDTGATSVRGPITAIDPIVDAASRTIGLRVEVDNAEGAIVAGTRCDADF